MDLILMLFNSKKFLFTIIVIWATAKSTQSLVSFTIPKTDVVHTKSGLMLHYLTEFQPGNNIVTFVVTIPMLEDMCYLIPIGAMKKIPKCMDISNKTHIQMEKEQARLKKIMTRYSKKSTTVNRTRRFITDIIAIGVGTAALTLSTVNTIQIANMKSEMRDISSSLRGMDQTIEYHQAQILHLTEGQLKLAQQLNHTQIALNKTIELVNEHSVVLRNHENALRTLTSMAVFLNNRLATFVHAVETHFIHTAIEDILSNRLNLRFIHHKDIPKVIQLITQATNITFDESSSSIPMVELITRLLVQQKIDFIPAETIQVTENGEMIGKLTFTSYFAAPDPRQTPFSVYELIAIPFNQGRSRVKLAQMPAYIGIDSKARQIIRWSKDEALSCNFVAMSSCRETPAVRKRLKDSCIYQILTDSILTDCRTELYSDTVFIHRVGQHWAVSTNTTIKCHSVTMSDAEQHRIIENDEIILPPVALITTMDRTSLTCDKFFLPGLPIKVGKTIYLIENTTTNPIQKDLVDLNALLTNDSHWAKIPYIPTNMQTVIDFISNTSKPTLTDHYRRWGEHPISWVSITMIMMLLILIIILIYCIHAKKNRSTNVTITMPSMKALQN